MPLPTLQFKPLYPSTYQGSLKTPPAGWTDLIPGNKPRPPIGPPATWPPAPTPAPIGPPATEGAPGPEPKPVQFWHSKWKPPAELADLWANLPDDWDQREIDQWPEYFKVWILTAQQEAQKGWAQLPVVYKGTQMPAITAVNAIKADARQYMQDLAQATAYEAQQLKAQARRWSMVYPSFAQVPYITKF